MALEAILQGLCTLLIEFGARCWLCKNVDPHSWCPEELSWQAEFLPALAP